jgi:crotonobetainyl-CoA:carnitine CoA-transferase CaiB-like acyl-CoA transferase
MALPLSGLRVVDLTSVLFGPYTTQVLGEFGADVIKVEPATGDVSRNIGPARHAGMAAQYLHINRGKRSLVLDLKAPEGREAVLRLARTADIFVSNVRPNAMRRLGLGYEELAAVRPDIIYAALVGYDQRGPRAADPAYDDLIQARVALPSLVQRAGSEEPRYLPVAIADRGAALVAMTAIMAAVIHRMKTGEGQLVEIPMFESLAHMILSDHLAGETYVPPMGPAGYARQLSPDRRPYRTKDGYISVLVYNQKHFHSFFGAIGRLDVLCDQRFCEVASRSAHIGEFYAIVAEILSERTTVEWLDLLERVDVPSAALHDLDSLLEDPQLAASGLIIREQHPTEGVLRALDVPTRWSRTQPKVGAPAPMLGQHSAEILRELGYSNEQIDSMCRGGITVVGAGTPGE